MFFNIKDNEKHTSAKEMQKKKKKRIKKKGCYKSAHNCETEETVWFSTPEAITKHNTQGLTCSGKYRQQH